MKRMQQILISCFTWVIVFLISFMTVTAQTGKTISKLYLQTGAGGGTFNSGFYDLGVQAIFKNKWSTTLSYQQLNMTPKNLPSDYQAESGYVFFIPYSNEVTVNMNMLSLTAGRSFNLGRNTWATAEAGLSYVSGETVSFKPTQVNSSSIIIAASTSSNYNTSKENKSTMGAMLKADINWAFASFMGLGAGVFANFNSIQSPVGFQLKFIVGDMGREKKNKTNRK